MADTNQDTIEMINNNDTINEGEENYEDCSDDEDDDYDMPLTTKTLQGLKQNDPAVTTLNIYLHRRDDKRFFNSVSWNEDVDCIANNTHLKKLSISMGEDPGQLQDFFSCIHRNCSIEDIKICSESPIDERVCEFILEGMIGHPCLVRFYLRGGSLGMGCISLRKVLEHPQSELKDLCLSNCQLDDKKFSTLCDSLLGNNTLKRLSLSRNTKITSVGWRELLTVLQHPNCKLVDLDLRSTGINDEVASLLGSALSGSSVKVLDLEYIRSISSVGWRIFFNQLAQTSIESLILIRNNQIDDNSLASLAGISTLKSLDLSCNSSISPTGWRSFFNSLQRRGAQLKKLDLSETEVGDVGLAALRSLLSSMTTLKTLNMMSRNIARMSTQGWVSFFNTIQDSNLDLVKLDVGGNNIDDDGLQLLIRAASRMSSLKHLHLGSNPVTLAGWQALSDYLQSPNFALKTLDLIYANINDDTVVALTSALANNETLRQLDFGYCDDDGNDLITERGWKAVSILLCNKTSIMNTYNSNHTLKEVANCEDMHMPFDLNLYLAMNMNKDKAEVARQKILNTHFSTTYDYYDSDTDSDDDDSANAGTSEIQEFLDMELEVMPTAISWIGRPEPIFWRGPNVSGLPLLFDLLRKVPDLFDSSAHKKKSSAKRKRS